MPPRALPDPRDWRSPGRDVQPAMTPKFSTKMCIWAMMRKNFPIHKPGGDEVDLSCMVVGEVMWKYCHVIKSQPPWVPSTTLAISSCWSVARRR
jgi:hypothetical protein